ncbi:MAG: hypothetical protein WKF81_04775 [Thermomicrobiales bacterium]
MQVRDAKAIADIWIQQSHRSIRGYRGAYLAGSICWLEDDDEMSPYSDIDLHLVVNDEKLVTKPGKFRFHDALLEVSLEPYSLFADEHQLLANAAISTSVSRNRLIDDPDDVLRFRFDAVQRAFPRREHVVTRLNAIEQRIRTAMVNIDEAAAFHDQAMWIFPASVTTHMLLTAGLGNPTVRRRFVEVGHMLDHYGESGTLELLLHLVGCDQISPDRATHHLNTLTPVYDATSAITTSTSRWVSDVSADSRSISIDGTQALIDQGYHREAMFWIVATYARCLNVIAAADDATVIPNANEGFRILMLDLGIADVGDIRTMATAVIAALPQIRKVANRIVDANPDVVSPSQGH